MERLSQFIQMYNLVRMARRTNCRRELVVEVRVSEAGVPIRNFPWNFSLAAENFKSSSSRRSKTFYLMVAIYRRVWSGLDTYNL